MYVTQCISGKHPEMYVTQCISGKLPEIYVKQCISGKLPTGYTLEKQLTALEAFNSYWIIPIY